MSGIHLITCLYNEPAQARIDELLTCLERNRANPYIASVDVFFDDSRPLDEKILFERVRASGTRLELISGRPTYRQLFEYANDRWPGETVAVANADIYFDETLGLLRNVELEGVMLALTRWNLATDGTTRLLTLPDGFPNYFSSDVWIFRTPLELDFYCDYELGTMFCDSFLNAQLFESHLAVFNPCLDLKTYHLQASESLSQQFEKDETIEQKRAMWRAEYARNGNRDPIAGVVWSTLAEVRPPIASREFRWRARHVVVRPVPGAPLDASSVRTLARIADDFDRNLWIEREGLDESTRVFVEELANATVNVGERYDSAAAVVKGHDHDLVELLRSNPGYDVLVPADALGDLPSKGASAVPRRAPSDTPRISVITPVLNGARFVDDAIQSVLRQDYPNVEHIVIDGGSTDGTIDILRSYPHLGWVSAADDGQSAAMNRGFDLSTGEIVVYLNADDYFLPGAFALVAPLFERGAEFVLGKVKVVTDDGSAWINNPRTAHVAVLRHWEPDAFCVNPVGYFYRRELQERIGGFSRTNQLSMDLEFLLECSQQTMLTKVDRVLGVFRNLEGTKTRADNGPIWTKDSFPYVDRFLKVLHDDFRAHYERARDAGYRLREEWRLAGLRTANTGTSAEGHEWGYNDNGNTAHAAAETTVQSAARNQRVTVHTE